MYIGVMVFQRPKRLFIFRSSENALVHEISHVSRSMGKKWRRYWTYRTGSKVPVVVKDVLSRATNMN